jgi:hypothetical protein
MVRKTLGFTRKVRETRKARKEAEQFAVVQFKGVKE